MGRYLQALRYLFPAGLVGWAFVHFHEAWGEGHRIRGPLVFVGLLLLAVLINVLPGREWLVRQVYRVRAAANAGLLWAFPIASLRPTEFHDVNEARAIAKGAVELLQRAVRGGAQADLLLVSGFAVIGRQSDPGWLYHALRSDFGGPVRVLMLDPNSAAAAQRAPKVGLNPEQYREGTKSVLWTLRELRESGTHLEVRLYQEDPIWQLVVVPKQIWVLYAGEGRMTDLSPMFCLKRDTRSGLSWGLEAVWRRRWNHPGTTQLDLSAVEEPDWDLVVNKKPF